MFRTYAIQLHQIWMLQLTEIAKTRTSCRSLIATAANDVNCKIDLRHNFSFFNEIVLGHRAVFHHFHRCIDGSTPFATTHHTKLART